VVEILEGGSGKAELRPGEFCRVGSLPGIANLVIADNPDVAAVHFVVECGAGGATVQDLNAPAGTLLNGVKIASAQLSNDDRISAGGVVVSVRFGAAGQDGETGQKVAESELTGLAGRVLEKLRLPGEPLFAVMDAARDPDVLKLVAESGESSRPLFEGEAAHNLMAFAPYLVFFEAESKLLATLLEKGWGKSWGVYFTSAAGFMDINKHLREMLVAEDEEGSTLLFRYYDPRVLRLYLPTCTSLELARFFGPILRFLVEDQSPESLLHFSPQGQGLRVDVVSLAASAEMKDKG